ncbi:MAG TPA: hypothetical protein VFJ85_02750 [Acidimicrobiales bacterium]|nr:hypothetical protein [Acidimicrobiales bacterium]
MPVGWIVVFILLVPAVGYLMNRRLKGQGYRMWVRPPSIHVSHTFDPAESRQMKGGSRIGLMNATWPLVTLSLDRECAHIVGPTEVWVTRERVQTVRAIRGTLGSGVRFDTADGSLDGVVFWTFRPHVVLEAFQELGWPVARPGTTHT